MPLQKAWIAMLWIVLTLLQSVTVSEVIFAVSDVLVIETKYQFSDKWD